MLEEQQQRRKHFTELYNRLRPQWQKEIRGDGTDHPLFPQVLEANNKLKKLNKVIPVMQADLDTTEKSVFEFRSVRNLTGHMRLSL